jgi:uncharacterized protein (DUF433 family)
MVREVPSMSTQPTIEESTAMTLERAEAMVHSDPEIMGGIPVIRGTRIPVALLAAMQAQGDSAEEIAEAYPTVSVEQARLAVVYMAAHPEPPGGGGQPWLRDGWVLKSRHVVDVRIRG